MATKTLKKSKKATTKKSAVVKMTDITVVLDRSGSMASVKNDTIGGFNTFLADQQKAPGDARLTLLQFDTEFETVHDGKPIADVPKLDDKTFVPRGSTALLDAVGKAIASAKARVKGDEKAVFVILTDGQENSSREMTKAAVKAMVEEQTKAGWNFIYLGANQDAFAEAGSMGIARGMTANYSEEKTSGGIIATSSNVSAFRATGQSVNLCYSDSQRQAIQ